jgi:hypothetical protein
MPRIAVNTGPLAGEVTVLGDGSPLALSAGSPAGEPKEPLSAFPSPPRQTERDPTELDGLHQSIEQGASSNPKSRSRGRPAQSLLKGGGEEIRGCGQRHHAHAIFESSNANPMMSLASTGGALPSDQAPDSKTIKQPRLQTIQRGRTPSLSHSASEATGGGREGGWRARSDYQGKRQVRELDERGAGGKAQRCNIQKTQTDEGA